MKKKRNQTILKLVGDDMKYGRLKILSYGKKGKSKTALCLCDCGKTKEVYLSNLRSKNTQSCGCIAKEKGKNFHDITGEKFGKLTAISPTSKRDTSKNVIWKCRCECGETIECSSSYLVRKYRKDCGCTKKKKFNIQGKKFGLLTVMEPTDSKINSKTKWKCLCDCGEFSTPQYSNLVDGHTRSCGCLWRKEGRTRYKGTVVECLTSKLSEKNSSGIKGVCPWKDQWQAYITLAKKRYSLGRYSSIEEAKEARLNAERKLFEPIIKEAYKKNISKN